MLINFVLKINHSYFNSLLLLNSSTILLNKRCSLCWFVLINRNHWVWINIFPLIHIFWLNSALIQIQILNQLSLIWILNLLIFRICLLLIILLYLFLIIPSCISSLKFLFNEHIHIGVNHQFVLFVIQIVLIILCIVLIFILLRVILWRKFLSVLDLFY